MSQAEIIEVDSVNKQFNKVVPIDKPFTVKYKIEKGSVEKILIVKKVKGSFIGNSIKSSLSKSNTLNSIDEKYWNVKREGNGTYLYINIADDYLFKPGDSYFIIPIFKGIVSEDVFKYFFAINSEIKVNGSDTLKIYGASRTIHSNLMKKYEKGIQDIVKDSTILGTMTTRFLNDEENFKKFLSDSNFVRANKLIDTLILLQKLLDDNTVTRRNNIIANFPDFSYLTNAQLLNNLNIQDDIASFLLGAKGINNSILNVFQYAIDNNSFDPIIAGTVNIKCINCKKIETKSFDQEDLEKRKSNLDTLYKYTFDLRSYIYLLKPNIIETEWRTNLKKIDNFLDQINKSSDDINNLIIARKKADQIIFGERFVSRSFFNLDILSGNSILSFEARTKITLVPEFGIVSSAFTPKGRDLEYGLIPYLGFSINFMGINKDVKYSSYTKDWRQRVSFGIGWSLVNLNKDSERASFFEKGSMLTGLGFRLSNTIKATAGAQMYFDISKDMMNNEVRKLTAVPYVGLSFDLSVKDFLGGLLDIIPGIGKTKNISSSNNNY